MNELPSQPPTLPDFATRCWFLTGPTASGKTALGIELARRLGAEVLSMDSMAIYRGMDIGTAKPTAAERQEVPHHLIDLVEPWEEFSVAQYVDVAGQKVEEVEGRGRLPLFVGGTPLYLKSLLRGLFEGPPADWHLRRDLEQQASEQGPGFLHRRLAQIDPTAAAKLHPNDTRRLIRAIEVYTATGQPISRWQQQFEHGRPGEECRVFVLDWPRDELYQRIDQRVEQMFAAGLVQEVESLLLAGQLQSRTARQAVGYRETIAHLQGEHDLATTIRFVQTHTRQFAKRQLTWFRSLSECRWIPMRGSEGVEAVADHIIDLVQ